VTVNARIRNLGTGDASNVEVLFKVNGLELGRRTIAVIRAGGSATASIQWGNVKHLQGVHIVVVTADPANTIKETNENNNQATRVVEVRGNKIRPR
jgi:subtilase family serine protease